jgi:hypothetical protein
MSQTATDTLPDDAPDPVLMWRDLTAAQKTGLVRPLAAKGLTAAVIAGTLSQTRGPISRNVVIGHCGRHGIGLGGKPDFDPPEKPGRNRKPGRKKVQPVGPAGKARSHALDPSPQGGGESPPEFGAEVIDFPPLDPDHKPVPFDDLGANSCRWPMWGFHERPKGEAALYCGRRKTRGAYCACHARIAYVPLAGRPDRRTGAGRLGVSRDGRWT